MTRDGVAIGVVGAGLMGGSLLRAVRARWPGGHLVAVEPDDRTRADVQAASIADSVVAAPDASLERCELVVLCAPIAAIEALLSPVSRCMSDGAVLTDVAGAKRSVVDAARSRVREGVRFVGAHPMFGGASGGFGRADGERWRGGKVAVCTDGGDEGAVERVVELHRALGADVMLCTADEHDRAVALVSHLPYLMASALALLTEHEIPLARALGGRGLADATRLASFSFAVQGKVARRNEHLRPCVDALCAQLRALADALDAEEPIAREAFERARVAKGALP